MSHSRLTPTTASDTRPPARRPFELELYRQAYDTRGMRSGRPTPPAARPISLPPSFRVNAYSLDPSQTAAP